VSAVAHASAASAPRRKSRSVAAVAAGMLVVGGGLLAVWWRSPLLPPRVMARRDQRRHGRRRGARRDAGAGRHAPPVGGSEGHEPGLRLRSCVVARQVAHLFTRGTDIGVARSDGSESRRLITAPGGRSPRGGRPITNACATRSKTRRPERQSPGRLLRFGSTQKRAVRLNHCGRTARSPTGEYPANDGPFNRSGG
jgi:hypothetical protein